MGPQRWTFRVFFERRERGEIISWTEIRTTTALHAIKARDIVMRPFGNDGMATHAVLLDEDPPAGPEPRLNVPPSLATSPRSRRVSPLNGKKATPR
jgi:hypothetical protein